MDREQMERERAASQERSRRQLEQRRLERAARQEEVPVRRLSREERKRLRDDDYVLPSDAEIPADNR